MNSARPMSTSTGRARITSSTSAMVMATPAAPAIPMKKGERRCIGGLVEVFLGIDAEGKSLEQVARPLTEVGSKGGTS